MVPGTIDSQGDQYIYMYVYIYIYISIYIYIYIYPQGISETSGSSDILLYLFEAIFAIIFTII